MRLSQNANVCRLHSIRSIPANLVTLGSPSDQASIHRCQLGNVWFLEASDKASIRRCKLGNVWFLEASDTASIRRCKLGNVWFLEASDTASIRRFQLGNVWFLEASDTASIRRCQEHRVASKGLRAIYADGAACWRKLARALKIKIFEAVHQRKEFSSKLKQKPLGLSQQTGTQVLDSHWQILKTFLPATLKKAAARL